MAKFNDKISSIISSQLPEFVVEDHPKFVQFLKTYYTFLESVEIGVDEVQTTDGILLETETNQVNLLLLDAGRLGSNRTQLDSDDKIILESSLFGKFTNGEVVKGSTSNAEATIVAEDLGKQRLFITAQNKFQLGETIVGQSSRASAKITTYRENPVKNIADLVSYRDPDNAISSFLTNFRHEFLATLPENLTDGLDKRTLIKNIKSLYRLKGTAEGNKIFFRILFGNVAETVYPRENLLRVSDGKYDTRSILRAINDGVTDTVKLIGRTITGQTSGATAIVENVFKYNFGSHSITEFTIDDETTNGTFLVGENVRGTENDDTDSFIKAEVTGIPGDKIIINDGALNEVNDKIVLTGGGEGAQFVTTEIGGGKISEIIIDDGGYDFDIGDRLVFDNTGTEGGGAQAFISVVNGGIAPEEGLWDGENLFPENTSSLVGTKYLEGPVIAYDPATIQGGFSEADFRGTINDIDDGTSTANIKIQGLVSGAVATIRYSVYGTADEPLDFNPNILYITYVGLTQFQKGETVYVTKSDSTVFTARLRTGFGAEQEAAADRDSVYQMIRDLASDTDRYSHIVLEDATTDGDAYDGNKIVQERNTGVGDITDIFTINQGNGYKRPPIVTFLPSSSGKDYKIKTFGSEIGRVVEIRTIEHGIGYEKAPTPPTIEFLNNSIITGLSGGVFVEKELVVGNTSGFTGVVVSFDEVRGLLKLEAVTGGPQVGEVIVGSISNAQGTLHVTDHASASVAVVSSTKTDGQYVNQDGHVSEDTMLIQDSLLYQDFSYIIKVGESINLWRDSFKKTMHSSGFYFTGEVAIESRIRGGIKFPVKGIQTGILETPIFSLLNTIFSTMFGRRMGTETDGTTLRTTPLVDVSARVNNGVEHFPANTRDTTVRLKYRVTGIVSRIKRQVKNVNVRQGFAYCGPTWSTLNKFHNSSFVTGNNASNVTFQTLSNIPIQYTASALNGTAALFTTVSTENGRLLKCNFAIPAQVSYELDLFSTTLKTWDDGTTTFDDDTPAV